MPDENAIKNYLIGLGFKVDAVSLNKMKDSLKQVERGVKDTSAKISSDSRWASVGFSQATAGFVTAAKAIAAAFTTVTVATVKLFDKTSMADLGYEKFALKMFMAKDIAKEFKIVTDAMGESYDDIAWIPELTARYRSLMEDARKMALPKDADAQFKYLRSIRQEFTRLKVEATYGMQWVSSALFKHLEEPIKRIKEGAVKLNDYIIQNMPGISEKIAGWIADFLLKGDKLLTFFVNLFTDMKELHSKLPGVWKEAWVAWGAAIAAVFVIGGPVTKAFIAISAALVAMKDFYAYLDGTASSPVLAPVWDALLEGLFGVITRIQRVIFTWDVLKEKIGQGISLPSWLMPYLKAIGGIDKQWEPEKGAEYFKSLVERKEEDLKKGRVKKESEFYENKKGEWVLVTDPFAPKERKRPVRQEKIEEIKSVDQRMEEWMKEQGYTGGTGLQVMKNKINSIRKSRKGDYIAGDYEYEAYLPKKEDTKFGGIISEAAKKYKLDDIIIKAIIQKESGFDPKAVGAFGEKGLGQLMPMHTKDMKDPFDPKENIMKLASYYKEMLDKYKDEAKAIAAYHIGETKMDKYGGGIPSYAEKYVEDVLRFKQEYGVGLEYGREKKGIPGISKFPDTAIQPTSSKEPDVTNNNQFAINLYGLTNEEQERRFEDIVRKAAAGNAVLTMRTAGVAP